MSSWTPGEIVRLMEMAASGLGIEVIALELKRKKSDVREAAATLRISLEVVEYPLLCPRCGSGFIVGLKDWCPTCELEEKTIRFDNDVAEEVRRQEEIDREDARLRKERERRREQYGTNPRKGRRKQ